MVQDVAGPNFDVNDIELEEPLNPKKLLKNMSLPVEKIDCCVKNCMVYWKDDSNLDKCKFCDHPRFRPTKTKKGKAKRRMSNSVPYKRMHYFPPTPHLQRLCASTATSKDIRGHAMRHSSDFEACSHFDQTYPEFAGETRNVRLSLCRHAFQATLQRRTVSDGSSQVDPNVVGNKKGKRYGLGGFGKAQKIDNSSSTSSSATYVRHLQMQLESKQAQLEQVNKEIQRLQEKHFQEIKQLHEEHMRSMLQFQESLARMIPEAISQAISRWLPPRDPKDDS